jgi:hypothetical protein
MMGGETPETCWATHRRQVINLWNCCILLVELFESYDDARTCERQMRFTVGVNVDNKQDSVSVYSVQSNCCYWFNIIIVAKFLLLVSTSFVRSRYEKWLFNIWACTRFFSSLRHFPPKQDGFQLCLQEHDNLIDTAVMTSTIRVT